MVKNSSSPLKSGQSVGRKKEFRIGDLPKEKITDPHLTTGPDQQVHIRHPLRVQVIGNGLRCYRSWIKATLFWTRSV
jgi:hypothetical protein